MKTFHLTVSSPDGNKFDDDIVFLSLRGADGDLAVLAGHIPFVTSVKPCRCRIEYDDGREVFAEVEGGLLSVTKTGTTLISGSFRIV